MSVSVPRALSCVVARPHRLPLAILAIACATPAAFASISVFDASTEGWTSSFGAATWESAGGNPGGFLRVESPVVGSTAVASASNAFLGDQSQMLGGLFTLDARVLPGPLGAVIMPTTAFSVSVTLVNGSLKSGSVTHVFTDAVHIGGGWVTLTSALTAAEWGVSQSQLLAILAGVTDMTVRLSNDNAPIPLAFGLDNVGIVPTPGAAALFAIAGLLALANRRR